MGFLGGSKLYSRKLYFTSTKLNFPLDSRYKNNIYLRIRSKKQTRGGEFFSRFSLELDRLTIRMKFVVSSKKSYFD